MNISTFTKTSVLLLLFLVSVSAYSQKTPFHVLTHLGNLFTFELEENPRFWKDGELFYVVAGDQPTVFVFAKISQIYWNCEVPTSIESESRDNLQFCSQGDNITISGKINGDIRIYSIRGILIYKQAVKADDPVTIDISEYEKGYYIVKTENLTFKFAKK